MYMGIVKDKKAYGKNILINLYEIFLLMVYIMGLANGKNFRL